MSKMNVTIPQNNNNNNNKTLILLLPLLLLIIMIVVITRMIIITANKKTIDISNETLIKTFGIFQIAKGQFDYFFI